MNLFDMDEDIRQLPLASRMRPVSIDEIVGQQHIMEKINYFIVLLKQIV